MTGDGICYEHMCPRFEVAIQLLGKKWTGLIVRVLLGGPRRFSDFKRQIPALSDRLLTERLKELEEHGVVIREVFPDRPVTIEYRLSDKGLALEPVVAAIQDFAEDWC